MVVVVAVGGTERGHLVVVVEVGVGVGSLLLVDSPPWGLVGWANCN